MATTHIPPNAQLSDAAEFRNIVFANSLPRLQHLAWRAINVLGKQNSEIVIICIEVDSRWRDLANQLMPNKDWDAIRATGAAPFARGSVLWGICEMIAEEFPDLAEIAREIPREGIVKAVILTDGGCTIYDLEPKPIIDA